MCGGSDDATKQAQQAEAERRRETAAATSAIERAFAGRQGQLDDFVAALREQFTGEARKQRDRVARRGKFSLARAGLTGGSAAADFGTRLGDEFQDALLESERQSQLSLSDLLSADEASKSRLLSLAQSGLDVGSAARQAGQALQSNITGAKARSAVSSLGDLFANTRNIFIQQEEAAQRRRGLRESQVFADPFSRGVA
jgi:hypothetical protein